LVPNLHEAPALDAFFVRALAKEPQARFPSATEMVEEFNRALLHPKDSERHPRTRRSLRWYRIRQREGGSNDSHGLSMNVVVGPRAMLGKQPECDIVCHALPSPTYDVITAGISREHAVLIWLDDRLSILDHSVNGTYVNGRRTQSRLTPVPDAAEVRMGEHLALRVNILGPKGPGRGQEVVGALLQRGDNYASGAAPTLMLWQRMPLCGSPLAALGGAMTLGALWVSQRELWWSGDQSILWQRKDGTRVSGPAALRNGDTLVGAGSAIVIEH
jgi:hypothetical protein